MWCRAVSCGVSLYQMYRWLAFTPSVSTPSNHRAVLARPAEGESFNLASAHSPCRCPEGSPPEGMPAAVEDRAKSALSPSDTARAGRTGAESRGRVSVLVRQSGKPTARVSWGGDLALLRSALRHQLPLIIFRQ